MKPAEYKKTIILFVTVILLGFVLDFLQAPFVYSGSDQMALWVFDVGQGDSILISSGSEQVLIDGGPSSVVLEKLERSMPFWDREIELVVNTHPHADHVTGLNYVLDRYTVNQIWGSGLLYSTAVYDEFLSHEVHIPKIGEMYMFENGATLTVLWPKGVEGKYLDDINDGSIVLLLEYGEASALLTADAGVDEEREFLSSASDIDILKVGHQGSYTSTSQALLDITQPEIAIISVGVNDYGHPHGIVLDRLRQIGAQIFRTDEWGDVIIRFDQSQVKVY